MILYHGTLQTTNLNAPIIAHKLYSATCKLRSSVKVHDINAGRRDSFGLLQSVLMNVIGLSLIHI